MVHPASPSPSPFSRASSTSRGSDSEGFEPEEYLDDIESVSLEALRSSPKAKESPALLGRVSPLLTHGRAEDDPRCLTPGMRVEAQHVEMWQKSLHLNQANVDAQQLFEQAGFLGRIRERIIHWFKAFFMPGKLPEVQLSRAFLDMFRLFLDNMEGKTHLQNCLAIEDIQHICLLAVKAQAPMSQEEKIQWVAVFEDQMRRFLSIHGQALVVAIEKERAEKVEAESDIAYNEPQANILGLACALVSAVREGMGLEPDVSLDETIDLARVYHTRNESKRYVISASGDVAPCEWDYVLKKGEQSFWANNSADVDIPRQGAQINGKAYFKLSDVVKALLEIGVEVRDMGPLISLLAQNVGNTFVAQMSFMYDLSGQKHHVDNLLPGRLHWRTSLEVDPKTKKYIFSSHFLGNVRSVGTVNGRGRPLFELPDQSMHDCFMTDLTLHGSLGKMSVDYRLKHSHLFPSLAQLECREKTSLARVGDALSGDVLAFNEGELALLKKEVGKLQNMVKIIRHMKTLSKGVSGLSLDDRGNVRASSAGGKRLRMRKSNKITQIQASLDRLRSLQRSTIGSDGRTLEGKSLQELELLVQESENYLKHVKTITHPMSVGNPKNPAFLWATGLLDHYYGLTTR